MTRMLLTSTTLLSLLATIPALAEFKKGDFAVYHQTSPATSDRLEIDRKIKIEILAVNMEKEVAEVLVVDQESGEVISPKRELKFGLGKYELPTPEHDQFALANCNATALEKAGYSSAKYIEFSAEPETITISSGKFSTCKIHRRNEDGRVATTWLANVPFGVVREIVQYERGTFQFELLDYSK